jgi:putative FmdB family regulatory protein
MPTYEYACSSCEHQFEAVQSIKDEPLTNCPQCHTDFLSRLISKTSFVLKGGGWAADNYGTPSK